jgi:Zn finger protein HypA/HybF involved in hydrogenase expression
LEFSFSAVVSKSPLAGARLKIEKIPFRVYCHTCGQTTVNEEGIVVCIVCGSTNTEIVSGTELELSEIELADTVQGVA